MFAAMALHKEPLFKKSPYLLLATIILFCRYNTQAGTQAATSSTFYYFQVGFLNGTL
jgi:hypothetical protein